MHTMEIICDAIRRKRVVEFVFEGHPRIVEPQILGKIKAGQMVLSAWQVGGYVEEGSRIPWRDYPIAKLSKVAMREENFEGPRPGYVKGGGNKFTRVFCEVLENVQPH